MEHDVSHGVAAQPRSGVLVALRAWVEVFGER
jgi:hypothetical protein